VLAVVLITRCRSSVLIWPSSFGRLPLAAAALALALASRGIPRRCALDVPVPLLPGRAPGLRFGRVVPSEKRGTEYVSESGME
jgi:hypothetical protein